MELFHLTIHDARDLLDRREISSVELTKAIFERIESLEPKIHAYITLTYDEALQQAARADERLNGNTSPLRGIPLALKDLLCTQDIRTTCGSRILENYIPPYDATVVLRLREAGAVFLGKTNMDEFAMGSSNEHSAFGPTRNPWDLGRTPGGSSGGSAAAVSADECIAALGSDTGGSVRQPAAYCGMVGLKPTYGRVSRYGLVAFASSLDQIGPMTKDVQDSAILLSTISGHDPRDSTSVDVRVPDYTQVLRKDLSGVRIGRVEDIPLQGVDSEVVEAVDRAVEVLESLGARQVRVRLPHLSYGLAAYYLVAPAEASSNLARYDGVKYGIRRGGSDGLMGMYQSTRSYGLGPEVKRRIMIGTYALSAGYYDAYYKKACQVRTLLIQDFRGAFQDCDVLVMPTAPTPAFKLGEKLDDPLQMYMTDVFTLPGNMAGLPGISVPCGTSRQRLPIGLQIIGNHFEEEKVLHVAYAFEQATDHHNRRPPVDTKWE